MKHAIGNWRDLCHEATENLAKLCSVGWKVELVNYGHETTKEDHLELANFRK